MTTLKQAALARCAAYGSSWPAGDWQEAMDDERGGEAARRSGSASEGHAARSRALSARFARQVSGEVAALSAVPAPVTVAGKGAR